MPRERLDALIRGDDCLLCQAVKTDVMAAEYGHTVADLDFDRLRLSRNQYVRSNSVVICQLHVCEPHELAQGERAVFFEDMVCSARALERVFNPEKLNDLLRGNSIPHLHGHLVRRVLRRPDARPAHPTKRGSTTP